VSVNAVFGIPFFKSGMFIPANFLAIVMLLLPSESSYQVVLNMCLGLLIGNIAFLLVIKFKTSLPQKVDGIIVMELPGNYYWLLLKSSFSYFGILGIQTLAFDLKTSAITLLAIPGKIVSGFTSIFINSVLPFHINTSVFNELKMKTTIWRYLFFSSFISIFSIIVFYIFFSEYLLIAIITSIWLLSSVGSSFAGVILSKKLPPQAVIYSVFPIIAVFVLLRLFLEFKQIDMLVLFLALALIDALSAAIQFVQIKYWLFAVIFIFVSLVLAMLSTHFLI
jgi:hypothetical protein